MGNRFKDLPDLVITGVEYIPTDSSSSGAARMAINALKTWLAANGLVATSITVNGHALTANITVSASDLTTGTLPHAQLPSLLAADIPARGNSQSSPGDPTAPASTSAYKMQGLAGSITPTGSGKVLIIVSGTIVAPTGTTAGLGILYQLSYGTGAAPSNAATLTGTQVGPIRQYTHSATVTAADVHIPFSVQALVTGLTQGTAYWIDLAAESVGTASDVGLANISITAVEL